MRSMLSAELRAWRQDTTLANSQYSLKSFKYFIIVHAHAGVLDV